MTHELERIRPMLGRVMMLYRVEFSKAIRQRHNYAGPLLLFLIVALSPLAHPMTKDDVGDYGFIAYVTPLALNFLGYILLLAYVSGLIATEISQGTLRGMLLRPVRREEIYIAKLLHGCTYSVLLTAIVGVTSWLLVFILGDLYGIQVGGEVLYTSDEMARAYLAGGLLSLVPQWAGASLSLLFSTLSRSAGAATMLSVGAWVLMDMIKYPLGIDGLVFTTYLEAPWQVFADYCDGLDTTWNPVALYCLLSSFVIFASTTVAGLVLFSRRDFGAC
jgi:ABC-2 type transport system permease protein